MDLVKKSELKLKPKSGGTEIENEIGNETTK